MGILKERSFFCGILQEELISNSFRVTKSDRGVLRRRLMTGEAFQLEFRGVLICLNGVQLPQVEIGMKAGLHSRSILHCQVFRGKCSL